MRSSLPSVYFRSTLPALTRVIWFLLTYYVFIIVHRVLKSRGILVFKVHEA